MADRSDIKSEEQLVSRMGLNDNKAGMQGLDKEKINRIILENTVGSRYYKNQQKRDKVIQKRILNMKLQLSTCTEEQKKNALKKADEIIALAEKDRDLSRTIVHIDMDAFYASVEERDKPELKNKPMAVGGMDMLSTSNYVARRYGVRAAMPGFIAKKLCPDLVIIPLNFDKYKKVSREVQAIFQEYDSDFASMSLDEAFLDITNHLERRLSTSEEERTFCYNSKLVPYLPSDAPTSRTFGFSAQEVAQEIRFRIQQKTLLTASAGIGPNTMLSKIGSDLNKPNGQTYFKPCRSSILEFMKTLPMKKVSGVGRVSDQLLAALNIKTCGDLYDRRADIVLLFSNVSSSFFLRRSLGCSSSHWDTDSERKSISTERTFSTISEPAALNRRLSELCEALADDLKKRSLCGRTLVLKIKTIDFESHTRSKTSNKPLSSIDDVFPVAKELLKNEIHNAGGKLALRLMGVGLSKLESISASNQASILKFFKDSAATTKDPESSVSFRTERLGLACPDDNFTDRTSSTATDDVEIVVTDDDSSSWESNSPDLFLETESATWSSPDPAPDGSGSNYACPICFARFEALPELNGHLDLCLDKESGGDAGKARDAACEVNTSAGTTETGVCGVSNAVLREARSDLDVQSLTCPVCSVVYDASGISLEQFNEHVDLCLNRGAIKRILQDDAIGSSEKKSAKSISPKKRRKLSTARFKSIDEFFV